ncbi:hypothetical protein [Streptomyces abikoensis]|uniref:Uncharacterized protein n=1 Tax=Streptomyces abikoensis TaxID=97398 RepID=A0ABW7T3W9_9ACTN
MAQTRARRRCSQPLLTADDPPGSWVLISLYSRDHGDQLSLTDDLSMAVYDLSHLPYFEQFRWRAQRCATHADTPAAADIVVTAWEPFNARIHHCHIQQQLPDFRHHRPKAVGQ